MQKKIVAAMRGDVFGECADSLDTEVRRAADIHRIQKKLSRGDVVFGEWTDSFDTEVRRAVDIHRLQKKSPPRDARRYFWRMDRQL